MKSWGVISIEEEAEQAVAMAEAEEADGKVEEAEDPSKTSHKR